MGSHEAEAWAAYVQQRRYFNARLQALVVHNFDEYIYYELKGEMLQQIRVDTARVLSLIAGISPEALRAAQDAITPWQLSVEGGYVGIGKVSMATRIHSLHRPAAVDVKMDPWACTVSYRVLDPVPADNVPRNARDGSWKPLLAWDQHDVRSGSGYRGPDNRFDMAGFEVLGIRSVLFGDTVPISLVDTVRLLLAALGVFINMRVADGEYTSETADPRHRSREGSGNDDWFALLTHDLRFDFPNADWLGVQIRRICNAAIPNDIEYERKRAASRDLLSYSDGGDDSRGRGESHSDDYDAMNF